MQTDNGFPADVQTSMKENLLQVRAIAESVVALVREGDMQKDSSILLSLLLKMKKLSRDMHFRHNKLFEQRQELKEHVGRLYVQRQNLEYQKHYIAREIEDYKDIESAVGNLGMLPLNEFVQIDQFKHIKEEKNHETMIIRLNYEFEQRKVMVERIKQLEVEIKVAEANNRSCNVFLSNLRGRLSQLSQKVQPFRAQMSLPAEIQRPSSDIFKLPRPLYTFYCHAIGTKTMFACDYEVDVSPSNALILSIPSTPAIQVELSFKEDVNMVFVRAISGIDQKQLFLVDPNDRGVVDEEYVRAYLISKGGFAEGFPFRWVQSICGLHFPIDSDEGAVPRFSLPDVVHRIKAVQDKRKQIDGELEALSEFR